MKTRHNRILSFLAAIMMPLCLLAQSRDIKGVVYDEDGDSDYYYAQLAIYNDYAYASADEEGGFVLIYGNFFKSQTSSSTLNYYVEWENGESGISTIKVNNPDGTVEYFNLNGIRLDNPTPGQIVIKREGQKATKTIVR